jgi:hypothetical protein
MLVWVTMLLKGLGCGEE